MNAQLPVTAAKLPPMTAIDVSSLQPQQLAHHRAQLSEVIETVLSGYWRDDMADRTRAMILADWCDEMEGWTVEQVRWALRKHREDQPNRKPNPGHILAILKEGWGRRNAEAVKAAIAPPAKAPRARMSDEARKAILAEVGIRDPLAVRTIDSIQPTA